ncbi:DUF7858 family protein [Halogranum rubrum]|uniref:DUF7858 family protein n=1 Tax=Halogranum rubrum TaxID=553466 RepID=UPI000677BCBD|nr:hypothetical protein [Halogranum salarium]
MGLEDIAAGIEVTTEQCDRGLATVDDTDAELVERFAPHASTLPCTPEAAATVVETHTTGTSVGESAREAGLTPMTAAKVLHRCGVAGVTPLSPMAREILRDWLAGELPRSDALALTDATQTEFALATYIETHDAVPALEEAVEGTLTPETNATVAKRDALGETMSDTGSLR